MRQKVLPAIVIASLLPTSLYGQTAVTSANAITSDGSSKHTYSYILPAFSYPALSLRSPSARDSGVTLAELAEQRRVEAVRKPAEISQAQADEANEGIVLFKSVIREGLRADEYAHNRLICGIHDSSDLYASRRPACATFGILAAPPIFQQDLSAARDAILRHRSLPAMGV
ncbi:MAG TPA: hypothetical protein VGR96_03155 [Acidobacteriaceae bacterium]|nr:hypothetical protein [Acidobacteriaceae bacterium]